MRKKEILPFMTTWMSLKSILLSDISQKEKGKHFTVSLIYGILKKEVINMVNRKMVPRMGEWGEVGKWVQTLSYKMNKVWVQFSSVQSLSHVQPHEPQHTRPPCPSPTPGVHWNPCPLSRWCHPTILSSVVPFSSCLQSFPASGSFQIS